MKFFISFYFLIQGLIIGVLEIKMHNSYFNNIDSIVLILSFFVSILSAINILTKSKLVLTRFILYLSFSCFVGIYLFSMLIIGGGRVFIFLICSILLALNIILSFKILKYDDKF